MGHPERGSPYPKGIHGGCGIPVLFEEDLQVYLVP